MVTAPHCGADSLSNDLTDDEVSSTGGHHRFALAPVYTYRQGRMEFEYLSDWVKIFSASFAS
jgi:hypothetical protein